MSCYCSISCLFTQRILEFVKKAPSLPAISVTSIVAIRRTVWLIILAFRCKIGDGGSGVPVMSSGEYPFGQCEGERRGKQSDSDIVY